MLLGNHTTGKNSQLVDKSSNSNRIDIEYLEVYDLGIARIEIPLITTLARGNLNTKI